MVRNRNGDGNVKFWGSIYRGFSRDIGADVVQDPRFKVQVQGPTRFELLDRWMDARGAVVIESKQDRRDTS